MPSAGKDMEQQTVSDALELELQAIGTYLIWMLETDLRPSVKQYILFPKPTLAI